MTRKDPGTTELAKLLFVWLADAWKQESHEGLPRLIEIGLTVPQIVALHHIRYLGETSLSALSERLHLSPSATSHLVQRLVEAGLVSRRESEVDRRQKLVEATAEGRDFVDRAYRDRLAAMERMLARIAPSLRAEIHSVIDRAIEATGAARAFPGVVEGCPFSSAKKKEPT